MRVFAVLVKPHHVFGIFAVYGKAWAMVRAGFDFPVIKSDAHWGFFAI